MCKSAVAVNEALIAASEQQRSRRDVADSKEPMACAAAVAR